MSLLCKVGIHSKVRDRNVSLIGSDGRRRWGVDEFYCRRCPARWERVLIGAYGEHYWERLN